MPADVGEKAPRFALPTGSWEGTDREGVIRTQKAEAVFTDLDGAQ